MTAANLLLDGAGVDPSKHGDQVRVYLRYATPWNFPSAGVLVALHALYDVPVALLLACAVLANGLLGVWAYRAAGRDRVQLALGLEATGLWVIAAALGTLGNDFFALTILFGILPMVLAGPYVELRTLLWMTVGATLVVSWSAIHVYAGPLFSAADVPQWIQLGLLAFGVPVTAVAVVLSLWQNRRTLVLAVEGLEEANRALAERERELEEKVRERRAELRQADAELRLARDEALAANRHKSAFLANMSHELRTPLNAVIGFSEVLSERLFGDLNDKQAEYIDDIHSAGRQLLELINDILDLSKIEAGHLELNPAPVSVAAVVADALTRCAPRAEARELEVRSEIADDLPPVLADARKLGDVLDNLLSNAVKFTEPGGRVTVRARARPEGVRIEVSDTGVGIAPEQQEIVFEAFRQGSQGVARTQEGTGLGLALSRRLVDLHGGALELDSAPGEGSTFAFVLPRADHESNGD